MKLLLGQTVEVSVKVKIIFMKWALNTGERLALLSSSLIPIDIIHEN
jgi:hypothetical protein